MKKHLVAYYKGLNLEITIEYHGLEIILQGKKYQALRLGCDIIPDIINNSSISINIVSLLLGKTLFLPNNIAL